MSVHSFQFVHVNSFMPIRSCQFMRFKSCVSIPLGQFPHVGSFVSIRSCHFLHVNSFMSIDSCQFIHFMHCISFQFTSFQAAMNSNKPCLFFEISAPARAGHYLVQPMHGDLRDVFLFTQINVYIYKYIYIYLHIYIHILCLCLSCDHKIRRHGLSSGNIEIRRSEWQEFEISVFLLSGDATSLGWWNTRLTFW